MKYHLNTSLSNFFRPLLLSRSFTIFILSVLFTQVAFHMMYAGFIFRIFSITSSAFSVSMLILIILIPQVLLSFIGGIVADLRSKKKILIIGNVLRALVFIPLLLSGDSLVLLYLVALIVSIITQFYVPAETPIIPYLVNKSNLLVANSVFGISLFGSILVGYILAGPVIQHFSHVGLFVMISLLYLTGALLAAFIPDKSGEVDIQDYSSNLVRKSLKEEIHNLFTLLRFTKEAGSSFFLLAFSQVVILILANVIPSYAENVLNIEVEDLSLLVFAPAAFGMIISALLIASVLKNRDKNFLMNVGVLLSGVILICFPGVSYISDIAIIQTLNSLPFLEVNATTLVPILAFFAGFANSFIFIPSQTYIQELVPASSRSKIFGLLFGVIGGASLIPVLISGGIADVFGVRSVLTLLGATILILGIIRVRYLK